MSPPSPHGPCVSFPKGTPQDPLIGVHSKAKLDFAEVSVRRVSLSGRMVPLAPDRFCTRTLFLSVDSFCRSFWLVLEVFSLLFSFKSSSPLQTGFFFSPRPGESLNSFPKRFFRIAASGESGAEFLAFSHYFLSAIPPSLRRFFFLSISNVHLLRRPGLAVCPTRGLVFLQFRGPFPLVGVFRSFCFGSVCGPPK